MVGQAAVHADQGGEPRKVIIMGMGLEDPVQIVHVDSQGNKGLEDVRSGIDEVQPSLEADHAAHTGFIGVPAVPFPHVNDGKVLPADAARAQGVGWIVFFSRPQVEVHFHGMAAGGELVPVEAAPLQSHPLCHRERFFSHHAHVEELFGPADPVKGKTPFDPHHFRCFGLRDSCPAELFHRGEAVIAPKDVFTLRLDLLFGAQEQRSAPGVVGMAGEKHPLAVQHLQDRELGQIGHGPPLDGGIGKEDCVGSGLERYAVPACLGNEPPLHQVLHAVRGTSALNPQVGLRYRDPLKARRRPLFSPPAPPSFEYTAGNRDATIARRKRPVPASNRRYANRASKGLLR